MRQADLEKMEEPEKLVNEALPDHLDQLVKLDNLENLANLDPVDSLVLKEKEVLLVKQVLQEKLDL